MIKFPDVLHVKIQPPPDAKDPCSRHCVIHCDIVASKGFKIEHQVEHTELVGGVEISDVKTIVSLTLLDKSQNEIHLRFNAGSRNLSQIIELLGAPE